MVYRRDGPGVIGIFNSRQKRSAWIDAQPVPRSELSEATLSGRP